MPSHSPLHGHPPSVVAPSSRAVMATLFTSILLVWPAMTWGKSIPIEDDGAFARVAGDRFGRPSAGVLSSAVHGSANLWSGSPSAGLPLVTAAGEQSFSSAIPDGSGGMIVVWEDARAGNYDIYAHHVLHCGSLDPTWSA